MASMALQLFLSGIAAPAASAALVLWLGAWLTDRGAGGRAPAGRAQRLRTSLDAVAVSVGYLTAHLLLRGVPSWPPAEAVDWVLVIGLAAGLGSLGIALSRSDRLWPWAAAAVLLAPALTVLVLLPVSEFQWSALQGALSEAGIAALGVVLAFSVVGQASHKPEFGLAISLVAAAFGSALAIGLSGSASLGVLAGAAGAGLLPAALWVLRRPISRASVLPFAILLFGLWLTAAFYTDVPHGCLLLLAAATQVGWFLPARFRAERITGTLLAAGAALGLVAAAAVWAFAVSPSLQELLP